MLQTGFFSDTQSSLMFWRDNGGGGGGVKDGLSGYIILKSKNISGRKWESRTNYIFEIFFCVF